MKRRIALLLPMLLLASCAPQERGDLNVLCSIFPEYEWAKAVVGDLPGIKLDLLQNSGSDLHSFQPTVSDIIKVVSSDVFIYNGGESDEWVGKALENATNPNMKTLSLLDALGEARREEEHQEGMEDGEEEEGEAVYDEHIWLSLENAKRGAVAIRDTLSAALPSLQSQFQINTSAYLEKLTYLSASYAHAVNQAKQRTLLVADRFPFLYLVKDYDLSYYAAFSGCSAESEASVSTVVFLAKKVDELGLKSVIKLESSTDALARTVIEASRDKNQKILTLNSLQSSTLAEGKSYMELMEENLETLKEALA